MPLSLPPNPYGNQTAPKPPGGYGGYGSANYGAYPGSTQGPLPAPSFNWMKQRSMMGPQKPQGPGQGMNYQGGPGYGAYGSSPTYGNNHGFFGPNQSAQGQQQGGQTSWFDQAVGGLLGPGGDFAKQEAASKYQFEAGRGLLGQLGSDIDGYQSQLMGQANSSAGVLQGQAEGLKKQGQQGIDQWTKLEERGRKDLQGGLGAAADAAAGGVDFAKQALTGFKDMSAADISANIWGMQRNFEGQVQQMQSGLRGDGTVMTPQEMEAQKYQLRQDFEGQRQAVITGIQSRQNEMVAQLTQGVSAAKFSQAGILQGNAQTLGQYDTNAGGQFAAMNQQRNEMNTRASQLYEVGEGYKQAAQMASIQARLNGQSMYADILQRFPYSPTSQFDAIMMLANVTDLQHRQPINVPQGGWGNL